MSKVKVALFLIGCAVFGGTLGCVIVMVVYQ